MEHIYPKTINTTTFYTKNMNHYKKFIPTEMEVRVNYTKADPANPFTYIFRNADAAYYADELYVFSNNHFVKVSMTDCEDAVKVFNADYPDNSANIYMEDGKFLALAYPTDGRSEPYVATIATNSLIVKARHDAFYICECNDHIFDQNTARFCNSYVKENTDGTTEVHVPLTDACAIPANVKEELMKKYNDLRSFMKENNVKFLLDDESKMLYFANGNIMVRNPDNGDEVKSNEVEVPWKFTIDLGWVENAYCDNGDSLYVEDPNLPKPAEN